MITCSKCRESKTRQDMVTCSRNRSGLRSWCRQCESVLKKAWGRENQERLRAYSATFRAANGEKRKREWKEYYLKVKDSRKLEWRAKKRAYEGLPAPTREETSACECCGRPPGKRSLNLDHCHTTGQFRGWLCTACNRGIGLLGDNREGVERGLAYLQRYGS